MINARAETLADKNAYKHAFRKRRCIVPADGFYEWKAVPGQKRKQPFYIHRADGEPLAFAGLWVILPPSAWDTWLDPDNHDLPTLGTLLVPAPPQLLVMHPVDPAVGNVRNKGPHLVDPVAAAAPDGPDDPDPVWSGGPDPA